jgi:hypothetical protein
MIAVGAQRLNARSFTADLLNALDGSVLDIATGGFSALTRP